MRSACLLIVGIVAFSVPARAQSAAQEPQRGYAEGFIQSSFGNVTSQAFGGEVGVSIMPALQIFAEGGRTRDVATSDIGVAAQEIANFLSRTQSGVSYSVKEPVTFGDVGVRYLIPVQNPKLQPYVLGALGIAQVTQNAKFLVSGTDVTGNLQQFGVVLGSDLSGSFHRALLVLGGGVSIPVWQQLVADLQFRYGRIFAEGQGINMSRAGVGLGVRF